MVDQLAQEYADQPVIFLEQDVDNSVGSRSSRWWAAYAGSSATLPLMMVDSGNRISNGNVDFYNEYRGMVEASLARPPKADITAYYSRVGDTLEFRVQVTNLSGVPLSWENRATVHALVYEEARVQLTGRFVRAAVAQAISDPLPHGGTATYTLATDDISGVNWENIRMVVLVDYRPSATASAYDTLQAAVPTLDSFTVTPNPVTFLVDSVANASDAVLLAMEGASSLNWMVTNTWDWLSVTPVSGVISDPPTLAVVESQLASGWQQGDILVQATDGDGLNFEETVTVQAYYGPLQYVHLPFVVK